MIKFLSKIQRELFLGLLSFGIIPAVNGQCLSITCPGNMTVSAASASCGAIVTYSTPIVNSNCAVTNQTISYTGAMQNYTVPAGVTVMTIQALGAEGGNSTSSSVVAGLGADITGVFTVTPGQVLKILVGQSPTGGNGGGGGTFVTDLSNTPWIIAGGGGGSSGGTDSPNKHGQAGTTGGTGAGGGGTGGTAGNGGNIGASFASGAGGGLLTNGTDGWTTGSGGKAFVNGGAAGTGGAVGGFGGGGSGSGYIVGAGGGGYSGGGAGSNSAGSGVGGGGGSYNAGTSQTNVGGAHSGNGVVYIKYNTPGTYSYSSGMTAGLASGANFPIGVTVQTFTATDTYSNTASCSFSVTVTDAQAPVITCPSNATLCTPVASSIAPVATDNCTISTITYSLSGATTGTGTANASGTTFSTGVTNVTYMAMDGSGNSGSCSFSVTINVAPTVSVVTSTSLICAGQSATLSAGGATSYSWNTGSNTSSIVVSPTVNTTYTVTGQNSNCSASAIITQSTSACTGIASYADAGYIFEVYPNPNNGEFSIRANSASESMNVEMYNVSGQLIIREKLNSETGTLSLKNQPNGIYMLKITNNNQLVYKTNIIKQ